MVVPILILLFLVSLLPVFNSATQSMVGRFSGDEGGSFESALYIRTIEPAVDAIDTALSTPNPMGIGIGWGAMAVRAFYTGSELMVTGEDNFSHELMEMGPLVGGIFELFKVFLAITIFGMAFSRARDHEPLALLLTPFAVSMLFFNLLEQPSLQGFVVISMAFCIAAAKRRKLSRFPVAGSMLQQQQARQLLLLRRMAFQRRSIRGTNLH